MFFFWFLVILVEFYNVLDESSIAIIFRLFFIFLCNSTLVNIIFLFFKQWLYLHSQTLGLSFQWATTAVWWTFNDLRFNNLLTFIIIIILKWLLLLLMDRSHVFFQITNLWKSFLAQVALVRSNAVVFTEVVPDVARLLER